MCLRWCQNAQGFEFEREREENDHNLAGVTNTVVERELVSSEELGPLSTHCV